MPTKQRKNPQVVKLRNQATRMRQSLEASSIRGDEFTPEELGQMQRHPAMRPMLANRVFTDGAAMEYAADGGLVRWDGSTVAMPDGLRVAHATDLPTSGNWDGRQRQCFAA